MKTERWLALAFVCALAVPLAGQEREPASGAYQISGVAVNAATSERLGRAQVTITLASGGSFSRTITTGEDGRFAFDHLRAGKYALSAERRGFSSQAYEQHEGRFSTAIVVGPELDATNLVFRIAPDASFSGHVVDDRNDPVRDARIMLINELMVEGSSGKRIVANTSTDDQGHYHFPHLKPGAYWLAVSARPWYAQGAFLGRMFFREPAAGGSSEYEGGYNRALDVAYPLTFYPDVTDAAAASAITLRAGERATADFTLRTVPALHVRIHNATSDGERQQLAAAMLSQVIFDGIEVPVQTTSRGMDRNDNLVSGIAPGHYLLRLSANGRGRRRMPQVASDDEKEQPGRVREVDLVADTELDASEMPAAAMVSGTVKLANGQAFATPPVISLRRGAMRRIFSATADGNGEFSFEQGFAAGSYEVVMGARDDLFIRSVTATRAKIVGRTLHISGSDAVKLTIIASAGAGKIEGVALRDGKPKSGAMILLVPQDVANNLTLVRRDQSDSDGTFTLATVLPGRYTLLALENGWDLQWGDPAVLKPFLAGGETIMVEAKGSYKMKVKVQ